MSRLLVLDGQIFQTPALFRGMGKYTDELMQAVCVQNKIHSQWDAVHVIISNDIQIDYVIADHLLGWFSGSRVVELDLVANVPGDTKPIEHNRAVIDEYVSAQQKEYEVIDFFVPALFQSQICPVFPSMQMINKVLLMHDLIPLVWADVYLQTEDIRREYLTKFSEMFRADLYVTNSRTVANDVCEVLGIERTRVVPILGGPIGHADRAKPYPVKRPFILMPTGNDARKNNQKGILGFKKFNELHNNEFSLVITSYFQKHEIDEFSRLADNVLFVGNVDGPEMSWLYKECAAMLFPSNDEGLGLPILEAAIWSRPVACSAIPVFEEMSDSAFVYFDQSSSDAIAKGLEKALTKPVSTKAYERVLQVFSWPETAKRFCGAVSNLQKPVKADSPGLTIYCPDPNVAPGGQLVLKIAAELTKGVVPVRFSSSRTDLPKEAAYTRNFVPYLWPFSFDAHPLTVATESTIPVYFIDDCSEASAEILCRSLAEPGCVVLMTADLRPVWEAALKLGLVSQRRFDIEARLSQDLMLEDSWLASLMYGKHRFVATSDKIKLTLEAVTRKMAKATDGKPAVQKMTLPQVDYSCPELITGFKRNNSTPSPAEYARELIAYIEGEKE